MAAKSARLDTELKFFEMEAKREADIKRLQITKELAVTKAEIEAVAKV